MAAEPIVRHPVPADNNCLFTSCAYLCQGLATEHELKAAARELREICANAVLADDDPATRALMLGHDSVEAYGAWIRNEMHWGGEPEVGGSLPRTLLCRAALSHVHEAVGRC